MGRVYPRLRVCSRVLIRLNFDRVIYLHSSHATLADDTDYRKFAERRMDIKINK